jgi:hypothetical protein|tara:strand:- start:545 stop:658 length:114 start_codon:yes stop_codon:yes gene_type:complete
VAGGIISKNEQLGEVEDEDEEENDNNYRELFEKKMQT